MFYCMKYKHAMHTLIHIYIYSYNYFGKPGLKRYSIYIFILRQYPARKYQMLYGSYVEFTKKMEDITIIQILFILH